MKTDLERERKKKALKIAGLLKRLFPRARVALNYKNNFELLVAVILSAQCTDKKVNEITKNLFRKYKNLDDYVGANRKDFEKDIYSAGFYRNKAKNILECAKIIKSKFKGKVPNNMKDLLTLPGVARKTANIILSNAFGKVEGIPVDTHVTRLSRRLGFTDNTNPDKIEQDLMNLLPQKEWFGFSYRLIEYGRKICPARKHNCENHPLSRINHGVGTIWSK